MFEQFNCMSPMLLILRHRVEDPGSSKMHQVCVCMCVCVCGGGGGGGGGGHPFSVIIFLGNFQFNPPSLQLGMEEYTEHFLVNILPIRLFKGTVILH